MNDEWINLKIKSPTINQSVKILFEDGSIYDAIYQELFNGSCFAFVSEEYIYYYPLKWKPN